MLITTTLNWGKSINEIGMVVHTMSCSLSCQLHSVLQVYSLSLSLSFSSPGVVSVLVCQYIFPPPVVGNTLEFLPLELMQVTKHSLNSEENHCHSRVCMYVCPPNIPFIRVCVCVHFNPVTFMFLCMLMYPCSAQIHSPITNKGNNWNDEGAIFGIRF